LFMFVGILFLDDDFAIDEKEELKADWCNE
jgi:hypothetical protein